MYPINHCAGLNENGPYAFDCLVLVGGLFRRIRSWGLVGKGVTGVGEGGDRLKVSKAQPGPVFCSAWCPVHPNTPLPSVRLTVYNGKEADNYMLSSTVCFGHKVSSQK